MFYNIFLFSAAKVVFFFDICNTSAIKTQKLLPTPDPQQQLPHDTCASSDYRSLFLPNRDSQTP